MRAIAKAFFFWPLVTPQHPLPVCLLDMPLGVTCLWVCGYVICGCGASAVSLHNYANEKPFTAARATTVCHNYTKFHIH